MKNAMFLSSGENILAGLGSEKRGEMLHTLLAVQQYGKKGSEIAEHILTGFCDQSIALGLVND